MKDGAFEWDDAKAAANERKHGVAFATAARVFLDAYAVERMDGLAEAHGEERYLITGMVAGDLLTVVYTERGEAIRLISARRATRREHDDYHRQNTPDRR